MTIYEAVGANDLAALKALVAAGAYVETASNSGQTALHLAVQLNNLTAVCILLVAGADPNVATRPIFEEGSETCLGLALREEHDAIAAALLAAGAWLDPGERRAEWALHWGVKRNNQPLVSGLLAAGVDVNSGYPPGDLLRVAAERGHVAIIQLLVEAGARLEIRHSFRGTTPLMVAAEHGQEEAVDRLIQLGADIDARVVRSKEWRGVHDHRNGSTALVLAARAGHIEVVRRLLAAGARPTASDGDGRSVAELAAAHGHDAVVPLLPGELSPAVRDARLAGAAAAGDAERVRSLLAAGANPEATARHEAADHARRPALTLAATGGSLDVVVALLAAGANPNNPSTDDRQTALTVAARAGHAAVIPALLAAGADPNARVRGKYGETGITPLMLAAQAGHTEAARALLEGGASVHARTDLAFGNSESMGGETALQATMSSDHFDPAMVALLVEAGAYPDARNEGEKTPLIIATVYEILPIIELLLAAGANPNSPYRDWGGQTLLRAAADRENAVVYQLFRSAGAVPGPRDQLHEALNNAAARGITELVDALLADGIAIDTPCNGKTPLAAAVGGGQWELARRLIDLGADPNGGEPGHNRPLHEAAIGGNPQIVQLLLDRGADPKAEATPGWTPLVAMAHEGARFWDSQRARLADCARALIAAGTDAASIQLALTIAIRRRLPEVEAVLCAGLPPVEPSTIPAPWDD